MLLYTLFLPTSVTVKVLLAIISGITEWIFIIKVALESIHQTMSNDISYIIHHIEISIYRDTNISM